MQSPPYTGAGPDRLPVSRGPTAPPFLPGSAPPQDDHLVLSPSAPRGPSRAACGLLAHSREKAPARGPEPSDRSPSVRAPSVPLMPPRAASKLREARGIAPRWGIPCGEARPLGAGRGRSPLRGLRPRVRGGDEVRARSGAGSKITGSFGPPSRAVEEVRAPPRGRECLPG